MIINITGKQMEITLAIRQHAESAWQNWRNSRPSGLIRILSYLKQPQGFVADATLSTGPMGN